MNNIKFVCDGRNVQHIIVGAGDKYGVAMIAYFRNSLRGENVQRLAVKDSSKVTLYFDQHKESYILQILDFSIADIEKHYQCFLDKYDILIQDPISHFNTDFFRDKQS